MSVQTAGLLIINTGEESWVFVCGAEVNGESSDWHTSRLLHKDWMMVTKSQQEVMMIACIDSVDVVHRSISVRQTVNFASVSKF
jgi:hypothetical protein